MRDLWPLLLSAQDNIAGIPSAFLEQKKEEIRQRQVIVLLNSIWGAKYCKKIGGRTIRFYLKLSTSQDQFVLEDGINTFFQQFSCYFYGFC